MTESTVSQLPLSLRLALSYAPRRSHDLFLGLFALDTKFAGIVRHAREPMLAQMRLAWWREMLAKPVSERPSGDLLLTMLAIWQGEEDVLSGLAEGWEILLAEPPFGADEIVRFAAARAACFAALARLTGNGAQAVQAKQAGYLWALADLVQGLSDPVERGAALALARDEPPLKGRLPRDLRPLAVLSGLARRNVASGKGAMLSGPLDMLTVFRLGLIGR